MKLNLLPAVLGATFLACANATPIRVIVVSSQTEVISPIRFGHAAHMANPALTQMTAPIVDGNRRKGCGGGIHDKAIEISNPKQ